jgi:hypothetical protein
VVYEKELMARFTSFGQAMTILCLGSIFLPIGSIPFSYAQTITNTTAISLNANPLVQEYKIQ